MNPFKNICNNSSSHGYINLLLNFTYLSDYNYYRNLCLHMVSPKVGKNSLLKFQVYL